MYTQAQLITLRDYLVAQSPTYDLMDDQAVADALNDTTAATRIKSSLSGSEVFRVTDSTEFGALTQADRTEWLSLCNMGSLDPANGTPAAATVIRLFGAGSTTLASLQALRSEPISLATEIGLPKVRADYVRIARSL